MLEQVRRRPHLPVLAGAILACAAAAAPPAASAPRAPRAVAECPTPAEHGHGFAEDFVAAKHPARIWFDHGKRKKLRPIATKLAKELDTAIWPKETSLMGKAPAPDGKAGGSPGLDICLAPTVRSPDESDAQYLGATTLVGDRSYVRLPLGFHGKALSFVNLRDALAHEFFHVLENRMPQGTERFQWVWWREATATWAIEYVYHADNLEHSSRFGLNFPGRYFSDLVADTPIDATQGLSMYGAYVLPWYLAQTRGPQTVAQIWKRSDDTPAQAIAGVLGDGLRDIWPKFMAENWNAPPFEKYKEWDSPFTYGVSKLLQRVQIGLNSATDLGNGIDVLKHLHGKFFPYDLPDSARTVAFINAPPYGGSQDEKDQFDPDAQVLAAVDRGGTPDVETLTAKLGIASCKALTGDQIKHLLLVFSNSKAEGVGFSTEMDRAPKLIVTADGCSKWQGHISARRTGDGLIQTSETDVTFEPESSTGVEPFMLYVVTSGHVTWSLSGTSTSDGCSYKGSDGYDVSRYDGALQLGWNNPNIAPDGYVGAIGDPFLGKQVAVKVDCGSGPSDKLWDEMAPWQTVYNGEQHRLVGGVVMSDSLSYALNGFTSTYHWDLTSPD